MLRISPGKLQGHMAIPPSKSHTIRAILFGSLGTGRTEIDNYLNSPDAHAMIDAMRQFGAKITVDGTKIHIKGTGRALQPPQNVIDAGNSGLVLRFAGALGALLPSYTIITGDCSIRNNRPVEPLLSGLRQLKAFAVSSTLNGKAPIIVRGPMEAGNACFDGADSQPVSSLLIAASFLDGKTELSIKNPGEKPWIDLTLSWLKKLGGKATHKDYESYVIKGPLSYEGFAFPIPGDLSSAAFPIAAALITQSTLTIGNIDLSDTQGDKILFSYLEKMGARLDWDEKSKTLAILPSPHLKGARIDSNAMIDAIPILAVLGCFAKGETEIYNGAIARKKESDRISAIALELRKMGADIVEKEDGLVVRPAKLYGGNVEAHSDHRIAMSLAVAALGAKGDTSLSGIGCAAKSFPSFISDFQKVGAGFYEYPSLRL